ATGDVRNTEPLRQPLSLCSLAGARRTDQQKAHLITRTRALVPSRVPCTASVFMARSSYSCPFPATTGLRWGSCFAARSVRLLQRLGRVRGLQGIARVLPAPGLLPRGPPIRSL